MFSNDKYGTKKRRISSKIANAEITETQHICRVLHIGDICDEHKLTLRDAESAPFCNSNHRDRGLSLNHTMLKPPWLTI